MPFTVVKQRKPTMTMVKVLVGERTIIIFPLSSLKMFIQINEHMSCSYGKTIDIHSQHQTPHYI